MGSSSSERRASSAGQRASDTQAQNSAREIALTEKEFELMEPLIEARVESQLPIIKRFGDLFDTASQTRSRPNPLEVIGGDPGLAQERASQAAQAVRSQYGNSLRNRTRNMGSSISGSGNLGSSLSGVNLSEDRAASSAFADTFNSIKDRQEANVNRQLESNEVSRYNFDLLEQSRPLDDQMRLSSLLFGQGLTNSGATNLQGALARSTAGAAQNAATAQAGAKPTFGSRIAGAGVGAIIGGL